MFHKLAPSRRDLLLWVLVFPNPLTLPSRLALDLSHPLVLADVGLVYSPVFLRRLLWVQADPAQALVSHLLQGPAVLPVERSLQLVLVK